MISDGPALLDAILADPEEDTPRLVYADWLEEHGQGERAEFVRVQVELWHLHAAGHGTTPTRPEGCPTAEWHRKHPMPGGQMMPTCRACDRATDLEYRERELWKADESREWFDWTALDGFFLDNAPSPDEMTGVVRRGFVESLTLSAADWVRWGDAIRRNHPVVSVSHRPG